MTVTEADRSAWMAAWETLNKLSEARAEALAPTDDAYSAVEALIGKLQEKLGEPICVCEACGQPVFEGEPMFGGPTPTCGTCAPTFEELISSPEGFVDAEEEPLGRDRCQAWFEEHIAAGGKPTDSMATVSP